MNRALLRSPAFARDLRNWLKSRPEAAASIEATLEQVSADAAHPSLAGWLGSTCVFVKMCHCFEVLEEAVPMWGWTRKEHCFSEDSEAVARPMQLRLQKKPSHPDRRSDRTAHAMIASMTWPWTSVRRRSMPLWRKVSLVWSMPSNFSIVAWRS
jgi:hypothetical protein